MHRSFSLLEERFIHVLFAEMNPLRMATNIVVSGVILMLLRAGERGAVSPRADRVVAWF